MKKITIYLTLLAISLVSCDSSNEGGEINELKATSNVNNSLTENDSITILSKEIFRAQKSFSKNSTARMQSYSYLESGNQDTDHKIFATSSDIQYDLMLILQTDGNLVLYKIQKNKYPITLYSSNPAIWSIGYSKNPTNNYGTLTPKYILVNQSDGNIVNYSQTNTPGPMSTSTFSAIWSSNTTVADGSFENQVLEMIIYRKATSLFGTNIRTFARLQIARLPLGGINYNFVSNIFNVQL